jgi:spermidine/putrescine transport system permease protein
MDGRRGWLVGASLADLAFLYAPLVVLLLFSFNDSRLAADWRGFTLRWYRLLIEDDSLRAALWNSLVVGWASTAVALALGLAAALALEGMGPRGRRLAEGLLVLPLVIPEVMMGVSLMLFFVLVRVPLSLATIAIGHTALNLPLVALIVRARLRKLDPALVEAALDLGATPWQAFRRITLPLLAPALAGAALLAFTLSLDDFVVAFFTAGPGATTLPLKIYSMVRTGISPVINALSAALVLASMALVGLSLALQRR